MGLNITDVERGVMAKAVRDTISTFKTSKFDTDVLVSVNASAVTSKISSIYKRHGNILQKAIAIAIDTDPTWKAWNEVKVIHPNYPDGLFVDTVLYDGKTLTVFEVKRGLGKHDSSAQKSIGERLTTAKLEAPQIFRGLKIAPVQKVECFVVSYYGRKAKAKGFTQLTADDVDQRFGPGVSTFWVARLLEIFLKRCGSLECRIYRAWKTRLIVAVSKHIRGTIWDRDVLPHIMLRAWLTKVTPSRGVLKCQKS